MTRKYRQPGYKDTDSDGDERRPRRVPQSRRDGPRSPRMMGFQKIVRCTTCGAALKNLSEIETDTQCPKCEADLHTCRNCVHFDTSARFECSEPVPKRVARKDKGNDCETFEARTRVEKRTTSSAESVSLDPRAAFEKLFEK